MLRGKTIVLGITGGIAAYKSAELVSALRKKGAEIICIMTAAACEFITPLTLSTLSGNPVYKEMFAERAVPEVEHIALADRAELFIIAPATANIIGKIASGIADDILTASVMATTAPVLIAPAMNVHMYQNPTVQDNIRRMQANGYCIVEPEEGFLACGYEGKGRLAGIDKIIDQAEILLNKEKPLKGKKVLVTAGPTCEPIDPVRYITNHSSGKMGYALAKWAFLLGAETTLISGPTSERILDGIELIKIDTALEMKDNVFKHFEQSDIIIKAAAVADYRPKHVQGDKIKKKPGDLLLELERNPDILAELGKVKGRRVLVGFAAETRDVLPNAQEKIINKNLDFIVANDLTVPGAGFGTDTNIVTLLFADGKIKDFPLLSKEQAAKEILLEALAIYTNRK